MYVLLYNRVIYNVTAIDTIKEFKQFIIKKFKTINEDNIVLSSTINKNTVLLKDTDNLIPYKMYMLTIKPIDCSIHKF
jgi:hypothetical protein